MGAAKKCPVKKLERWGGELHFVNCERDRHEDDNHEGRGIPWTAPSPPMKRGNRDGAAVGR